MLARIWESRTWNQDAAGRDVKRHSCCQNQPPSSSKGGHGVSTGPGNSTPRYVLKKTENTLARKLVQEHSQRIFIIAEKQKVLEGPSTEARINQMRRIPTTEHSLAVSRNEETTRAAARRKLENTTLKEARQQRPHAA